MPEAAVVLRAADTTPRVQDGQRFYIGFGVFIILLSFAGFAPSLIDQSRRFAPPNTLLLVHGVTSLAWLLLYVTQALLVAPRLSFDCLSGRSTYSRSRCKQTGGFV